MRKQTTARRWTAEEDRLLRAIYPDHDNAYVTEFLHRSKASVTGRARVLGLRKSPEAYAAMERKRHETRNDRIRRSRLRMRWGLEPIYKFLKKYKTWDDLKKERENSSI